MTLYAKLEIFAETNKLPVCPTIKFARFATVILSVKKLPFVLTIGSNDKDVKLPFILGSCDIFMLAIYFILYAS
jgi:hypothetical protein